MRRLTEYHPDGHVVLKEQTGHGLAAALERLAAYEDCDIMPEVVQTWSQMYDEGTLVPLPAAPGSMVKYKGTDDVVQIDCVNIYSDGRITYSFHERRLQQTWVDDWSEDDPAKYDSVTTGGEACTFMNPT